MTNGKSRAKGKRGELDVKNKLGGSAKRTGHSFQPAPDVVTNFAAYSIKNRTIGGATILWLSKRFSHLNKCQTYSFFIDVLCRPRPVTTIATAAAMTAAESIVCAVTLSAPNAQPRNKAMAGLA